MPIDDDDRASLAGANAPRSEDPRGDEPILPSAVPYQASMIDWWGLWTLVAAAVIGGIVALVHHCVG